MSIGRSLGPGINPAPGIGRNIKLSPGPTGRKEKKDGNFASRRKRAET